MKILCDFCGEGEASVFCCADEAALCSACDRSVHWANKLAGKHHRLSLDDSGSSGVSRHPPCDVCKEKRAFLFCQEDRAILCRDCDEPIHSANHLTMKHNRFLLAGVRVSAAPIPAPEAEEGEKCTDNAIPKSNRTKAAKKDNVAAAVSAHDTSTVSSAAAVAAASAITDPAKAILSTTAATASSATSDGGNSISDYLIKMCPGWHVEDLLVDDATAAAIEAFSKPQVEELLPFLEADMDSGGLEAICAPHVPQYTPPVPAAGGAAAAAAHHQHWLGGKEMEISFQPGAKNGIAPWSTATAAAADDVFTVPQISPVPAPKKRSRHSTWYF